MKAFGTAVVITTVLVTGAVWAADDDKARPRGGSSGGGSSSGSSSSGSSSAGSRHHSGGSGGSSASSSSSSSRSSGGGSGSVSSSSSSSSRRSSPSEAQLRHPRAGTGTGFRHRDRNRSYWYDPYWYGGTGWYGYGWYGSPYSGWYSPSYYGGVHGYSPYQHRYGYSAQRAGALRVLVEPNEARVYVDGYYAGIADDFDGIFQRLHIAPGRHDIALKLDGYRSQVFKVYVPYDATIKLHHRMARGTGDDVSQDVLGRPEDYARDEVRRADADDEYESDESDENDRDRDADQGGDRGLVRLDVRPGDASVYVDGAFRGTARELRQLRLTPGRHRVEVVRPGYRTVEREIEVRRGDTQDVEIDLDRS